MFIEMQMPKTEDPALGQMIIHNFYIHSQIVRKHNYKIPRKYLVRYRNEKLKGSE